MVDPITASALITGGSALLGGFMGNKAAKQDRAAQMAANRMNMMPYLDAQPYTTDLYQRGQSALDNQLNTGYYQGQTFADLDPMQQQAIRLMQGAGTAAGGDATNFMSIGRGFANNYGDIYNRAQQDMLGNALSYASANTEPLLANAMRDPYRQLTEQTLPNIDRTASASMNTNSSRAGIADAIAQRAFDDRSADAAANIQDRLIDRSMKAQQAQLSNMTAANKNLGGLYNMGFSQSGDAARMLGQGGGILQAREQSLLDDDRARFEGNRDYDMNALMGYNAGILGRTPTSVNNIKPATANPMMGGLSGAMAGFGFGQKYGGKINDYFSGMGGGQPSSSYGNFMTPQQQRSYFGGMNFGGNNQI